MWQTVRLPLPKFNKELPKIGSGKSRYIFQMDTLPPVISFFIVRLTSHVVHLDPRRSIKNSHDLSHEKMF